MLLLLIRKRFKEEKKKKSSECAYTYSDTHTLETLMGEKKKKNMMEEINNRGRRNSWERFIFI